MRLVALGLLALAFAAPTQAQEAIRPSLRSTFVVPAHAGEAIRVTTYARRPPQRGRLARRYRGIRVNRSPRQAMHAVPARPAAPLFSTPSQSYVRKGGSYFRVVPAR
ncbi:hypothetical protein [Rubrivirga sp. IMCC45206]|uniref:hypothetical protein n=1 Tax=Rubrivirga sp. IMCC45206 TaxID=3391614 RepID=UPI00399003AE